MPMRGVGAVLGLLATLALAGAARAGYPGDGGGTPEGGGAAAHVDADGNAFTGGLRFDPAQVSVAVGDVVAWTNTDPLVPHTATEDHGLWALTGSYGGTPFNPPGFAPGETRQRAFEAGTFNYYCEVHPVEMRGVVRAAPTVKRLGTQRAPRLRVIWSPGPPADGQVFDVERKRHGHWKTVREGTTDRKGGFAGGHGKFRTRLRLADDPTAASGWSPVASN